MRPESEGGQAVLPDFVSADLPRGQASTRRRRRTREAELAELEWARITVPYIAQWPVMRRSPDGGLNFPRASSKGYRYEVAIQARLPNRPATVPVYNYRTGAGRLLVLDLDASRVPAEGAADRAGYIAAVAGRIVALLAGCGGRALVDVSPSGGRHVYVLWERPRPFREMRVLARAFNRRFPVVDPSPMESINGQIRGPGAPHRSIGGQLSGYMRLACSLEQAEAICQRPCGPEVWARLHDELAAELDAQAGGPGIEVAHPGHPGAAAAPLDACGEPFRPRRGGRNGSMRGDLAITVRTGRWDPSRYRTSSEARQGLLDSVAARGWRLAQVRAELAPGGGWTAIAGWWRDEALLRTEWDKAIAYVYDPSSRPPTQPAETPAERSPAQKPGDPVRSSNTRGINITPPGAPPASASPPATPASDRDREEDHPGPYLYNVKAGGVHGLEVRGRARWELTAYQQIRIWQQAMHIVERLLELEWGRRGLAYRAILRAIGAAAQMTGSTVIEFGCRQLAYATGLDHTTVARALQVLRDGPYALIDLVQEAEGTRADRYQLTVPDPIADEAAWRRWRPGRIDAIHACFRTLGLPAAFAYEALGGLDADGLTGAELAVAALLPRSTAYQALHTLAEHGLAHRDAGGRWRRGPADPDQVARITGADQLAADQLAGHRADRADWHRRLRLIPPPPSPPTGPAARGRHAPVTARTRRHRTTGPAHHRHRARRRLAPPWLHPPPPRRITETDIDDRPVGTDAELAAATRERPPPPPIPDDVRAAINDDLAAIAGDERTPAQQADYDAVLHDLRQRRSLATEEAGSGAGAGSEPRPPA